MEYRFLEDRSIDSITKLIKISLDVLFAYVGGDRPQPLLYLSYYGMQFFEISSFVAGNLLDVIIFGNWIIAPSAVGGYLGVFGNVLKGIRDLEE